ncbi:tachykinin-like peptides receptor 86C [Orbicella faveolata]|uniref:tachykinin-like peptides receptor 86C n=1 Tax=Orbicella faveolata TaxID=48498 RepID=UPI0009E1C5D4|nr:tachykinin-like peptides receptor 86C [Orbicella faveolata]
MSLRNNTMFQVTANETTLGQQNRECIFTSDSTVEKISKLWAYCVILLGSFFGNAFIIAIVYKHRDLHKTINYFIVNMAVSDLIFPLLVLPVQIRRMQADSQDWPINGIFGLMFCKLCYFASLVSMHVSAQSLVWIAIDRFVAVVFPLKLGLISKKIRTIAIVSMWIFAGFLHSPSLIVVELVVTASGTVCKEVDSESVFSDQEAITTYLWLQFTFLYIGPLFSITILYTAIAIALKKRNKALANTEPNVKRSQSMRNRRQAMLMAVVIMVLYYICVTPHTLLHFVPFWRPSCAFLRVLIFMASFSIYSSSIVNPTICLTFVKSYRRGLRNILCPCSRLPKEKMTKPRGQITLKKIKNLTKESRPRHSKDSESDKEILDTAL